MTKSELTNDYLDWLYRLVYDRSYIGGLSYRALFRHLHSVEFAYMIEMDANRAYDGVDLRYRFGHERKIETGLIGEYLDDAPCSVLEMMAALSLRCEEHIMDDTDQGERVGKWFWGMINNLNLLNMTDDRFNKAHTNLILSRLLRREYKPNGEGGLFKVANCQQDMRDVEIWYQQCWYLNELLM